MVDDLNVILKAQLDVNETAKEINVQLDQLEDKMNKLGIDINIDGIYKKLNDSINKVKTSIEQIQKSFGTVELGDKFTVGFDKLTAKLKEIKANVKDISNVSIGTDQFGNIDKAVVTYKELGQTVQSTMKLVNGEWTTNFNLKDNTKQTETFNDSIKKLEANLVSLKEKIANLGTIKGLDTSVYTNNIKAIEDGFANLGIGDTSIEEQKKAIQSLLASTNAMVDSETKKLNIIKQQNDLYSKINASQTKLKDIETVYSGADTAKIGQTSNELEELRGNIEKGNISIDDAKVKYKELSNSINGINTQAKKASASTSTWAGRLTRVFQFTMFYRGISLAQEGIREMISTVSELDSALVDLQKVTTLSGQSLDNFTRQAYELGSQISKTGKDVITTATEFAKSGDYTEAELLSLSKYALTLTSIGDGLTNAKESANTIISVMKGFGKSVEDVGHILDSVNEISNRTAVDFSNLTFALSRMSGTMNASGVEMEQAMGLFVAIDEVLRNSEISSTSLNTLTMRLRGLNEEGESLGTEFIPKLQKAYKSIAGIDLTDTNGQVKNLFEITSELAPVWNTLSENQRQYLAQESAGVRQAKSFLVLMNNYDRVLEATTMGYNSAGSAQEEFTKWQDSIEGKTNNLTSALEKFSSKTLNSDFIKAVIDATTTMVRFGTSIGGAVPVVMSLVTAFGAFKAVSLINNIEKLTGTTLQLATAFKALGSTAIFGWTAIAIAGIIGVGLAINSISERANKAKEAVNTLSTELSDLQSDRTNVTDLSRQFAQLRQLSKEQELNNEEQQRFIDIQNQLRELLPEVNGHYDQQGNFIISEKENIITLTDAYEELIDAKRQALVEASNESYSYNIDSYKEEKQKVEDLIRLQELYKTAKERTLTDDEFFELNSLRDSLKVPFDELDKAIKESRSSISQSLTEVQNDIRNKLFASDEWKKLSSEMQDSLVEELSKVNENTLPLLSEGLFNGTISLQTFIDTLKRFYDESKKTEPSIIAQKTEFVKLQESYLSGSITLTEYTKQLQELNKTSQVYKREINDLAIVQEYLDSVLEKVTSNQSLSKDEVEQLCELYPELKSAIYKTADGWSVESDVLSLVSTSVKNLQTAYINAQNAMSIATSSQAIKRLNISLMELESIQGIADAYRLISQKSGLNVDNIADESLLLKNANNGGVYAPILDIGKFKSQIKEYQDLILNDLNPSALESKSTDKKDKHIEAFEKQYNELKYLRDKDLISAQQYYDSLKSLNNKYFAGNSKYIDQFRQYDTELYNLQKELAQQHIEDIINSYEKANKEIQRNITQLDLRQQLVNDNSQEYIDIEKKKYDEIVKLETELQKTISELQAIGSESAKEQAESLIDTYYDTVQQRYSIITNLQSSQISIFENQIDELEKQKSALEDLHDFTMQMIKDELNAKKKSLQEDLKGIEAVFNAKKKALRDEQDNRSYEKGLTEKSSLVADLENQLAIIKNDETAIAKRKQLEEELAKAKEDLADYQYEHSIDLQEKALDSELEKVKQTYEDRIDELDETLSNEIKLRELADKKIKQSGEKLYKELINYSKEYGSITKDEIKDAWDNANISLNGYKDTQEEVLKKLKEVTAELNKIENLNLKDYSSKSGYETATYNEKLAQMKSNSAKWTSANTDERKRLAEENQKLGKELGLTYDSVTGTWYYDKQKKLRVYHTGGIVGGNGYATKSTEELAKLLKGELVITPPQADKLMSMITNNNTSQTISPTVVFNIEGEASQSTIDLIKQNAKEVANIIASEFNKTRANTGWKKPVKSF